MRSLKYLMIVSSLSLFFGILSFVTPGVNAQSASIGISPPYIQKENLLPGSHYEQEIVISRANPDSEATALIELEEGEVKSWISFSPGLEVPLPQGVQRVTLKGIVDIPQDVKLGTYNSYARLSLQIKGSTGQVELVPAERIDINLSITDKKAGVIKIRQAEIEDFPPGEDFVMFVQAVNEGNVSDTFSRAVINIYDLLNNVVKTLEISEVEGVPPFSTKQLEIYFSDTGLVTGDYIAELVIYKGENMIFQDTLAFAVKEEEATSHQDSKPDSLQKQVMIGLLIVGFIAIVSLVMIYFVQNKLHKEKKTLGDVVKKKGMLTKKKGKINRKRIKNKNTLKK